MSICLLYVLLLTPLSSGNLLKKCAAASQGEEEALTVGMAMSSATSVPRQSAAAPSRRTILRMPSRVPAKRLQSGPARRAQGGGGQGQPAMAIPLRGAAAQGE